MLVELLPRRHRSGQSGQLRHVDRGGLLGRSGDQLLRERVVVRAIEDDELRLIDPGRVGRRALVLVRVGLWILDDRGDVDRSTADRGHDAAVDVGRCHHDHLPRCGCGGGCGGTAGGRSESEGQDEGRGQGGAAKDHDGSPVGGGRNENDNGCQYTLTAASRCPAIPPVAKRRRPAGSRLSRRRASATRAARPRRRPHWPSATGSARGVRRAHHRPQRWLRRPPRPPPPQPRHPRVGRRAAGEHPLGGAAQVGAVQGAAHLGGHAPAGDHGHRARSTGLLAVTQRIDRRAELGAGLSACGVHHRLRVGHLPSHLSSLDVIPAAIVAAPNDARWPAGAPQPRRVALGEQPKRRR